MAEGRILAGSVVAIIFLALLGILTLSTQSFAQTTPTTSALTNKGITVSTQSPSYGEGDTIVISGKVNGQLSNTLISIRVENPSTNLVAITQVTPNSDGSFSKTLLATGPLWTKAGNYTVIVQNGTNISATTVFYFSGGNGQPVINKLVNGTYALQPGQIMFNVPYAIQGGTIQSMQVLSEQSSLAITISSTADGSLTVNLPRALIDSKQHLPVGSGQAELPDQPFIVQIDGKNVIASQTSYISSRTLGIPFHDGDTRIYIIGTSMGINKITNAPNVSNSTIPTNPLPSSSLPTTSNVTQSKIPSWIKNIFIWYGRGSISDDELLGAIQFLVQQGIIHLK